MANPRTNLYNNLSAMLNAGLPIIRSLDIAADRVKWRLREAMKVVARDVKQGISMAEAMAKFPRIFAPLDVLAIHVGETSGNMPDSLKTLADWYAIGDRLRRIILSGMIMPLLVLHVAAFGPGFFYWFFNVISLIQYLLAAFTFLSPFYILAAVILGIIYLTPKTGPLRRFLDRVLLCIPLVRKAISDLALSRFCSAFYLLSKASILPSDSILKAAQACGNNTMASRLKGGAQSALEGSLIVEGFSPRLPLDFREAWSIGEESGQISNVAKRQAHLRLESAEFLLTQISRWIPRLIYFLVFIAILIQLIQALRILTGIYSGAGLL
ncbi:MAG: type II secretion system F family protein [Sedimentisphaerales bacterium]|nr:type II secretion system F family protein [Sedimentisphaerales bacterium]